MDLSHYADLAGRILNANTPYSRDKKIIASLFINAPQSLSLELVHNQLVAIDSYYSTNMSKRYYGIEEIAEAIINVSYYSQGLKNSFINYVSNPDGYPQITELFNAEYGYHKTGSKYGKAVSLISKYAYFISGYNFPIYDSIVREVYPLLTNDSIESDEIDKYVLKLSGLLKSSNISDFNKLDNLLWLIGKINRGNYSLILKKDKYLQLVSLIPGLEKIESISIDERVKKFVIENLSGFHDIFTGDQLQMIKYCISLR